MRLVLWLALILLGTAPAAPRAPNDGRVSVLIVKDENPLIGRNLTNSLASPLEKWGYNAKPLEIALAKRGIAAALQDTALS